MYCGRTLKGSIGTLVAAVGMGAASADWEVFTTAGSADAPRETAAFVEATDGYRGAFGLLRSATLRVRCRQQTVTTDVETGSFLPSGETRARIRFDEAQLQPISVSVSEDNSAVHLQGGGDLLSRLSRHHEVLLELQAGENRYLIRFSLDGSARAIAQVVTTCREGDMH